MSQKANPTLIGAFVFGAAAIALGAVIFLGIANLFVKKQSYVTYFNQSVSGLSIGSNVKYKGVTLGKVTQIVLEFEGEGKPASVKVVYEIDTSAIITRLNLPIDFSRRDAYMRAVASGLRAKLEFESIISGQLFISLDIYKDAKPAVMQNDPRDVAYFEIPSQPSDIDTIVANLTKAISNLGNVDFLAISKDFQSLIASIKEKVESLELEKLGPSLTRTSDSIHDLVTGEQIKGTLKSIQGSFDQLTDTLKRMDPSVDNLKPTLDEAKATLANLQTSTAELARLLKPDSSLRYQLDGSLSQINAAAESIQRLSEFLQRHPNSILFGRKLPKEERP
jgi:phospholipid/cholesterol/gamma-HCH transport system substrate-binding protein